MSSSRALTGVVFVVYTAFAFVIPFLPLYVRELGVTAPADIVLWAGVLTGVAPLIAGLLAPAWGRLADRHGGKRVLAIALLAYVIFLAASAAVTSVLQLLLLRIGIGIFGGIGPLALAMASASVPASETGRAIGRIQAAQNLSNAAGPFVGGALADIIGIRATFLVTAVSCAAALALLVWGYTDAPRVLRPPSSGAPSGLRATLPLLALFFLLSFAGRAFTPMLPLQIEGLGVAKGKTAAATGLLISLYSIAAAVAAATLGRATTRYSARTLLGVSLVAGAALMFPMAGASSLTVLLVLAALFGLAFGGALVLAYTIGGYAARPDRKGAAFGLYSGAALVGGALSPAIAGLLSGWDLHGIYYVNAVLFLGLAAAVPLLNPAPRPELASKA